MAAVGSLSFTCVSSFIPPYQTHNQNINCICYFDVSCVWKEDKEEKYKKKKRK